MDVNGGQIGVVVLNDLLERELLIDEFQNILYCYSRTCDARLSEVNPCIDDDSVHVASLLSAVACSHGKVGHLSDDRASIGGARCAGQASARPPGPCMTAHPLMLPIMTPLTK